MDLDETSATLDDAIAAVTEIVRELHRSGCLAVPSCDYEDQLPDDAAWDQLPRAQDDGKEP